VTGTLNSGVQGPHILEHRGQEIITAWLAIRKRAKETRSINRLRKASSLISTLKSGSVVASTNIGKASLINDVFSENFNSTLPPLSPADLHSFQAETTSFYLITSFVLKKRSSI